MARPDAGVHVGVFFAQAIRVVGIPLCGAGRLAFADGPRMVSWCPAWVVVPAWLTWVGWGWVSGMLAPGHGGLERGTVGDAAGGEDAGDAYGEGAAGAATGAGAVSDADGGVSGDASGDGEVGAANC